MKAQIKRLSPHQNAKVFAVMMALFSLVFMLPFFFISMAAMPHMGGDANAVIFPTTMVVAMPLIYLVFTYVGVFIACMVYNVVAKYIGGFEFILDEDDG